MKKLLLVLAIGAFAACGEATETDEIGSDTTSTSTVDSTVMAAPDTTNIMTDTSVVRPDSAASVNPQ